MSFAVRNILVTLLVLSQLTLGARAGGFVCLGPIGHTEPSAESGECTCDHAPVHDSGLPPQPVAPHDQGDCPCIDVAAPIGRVDHGRTGDDLLRDCSLFVRLPVPHALAAAYLWQPPVCADQRPPGFSGLIATHLLL